MSNLRFVRLNKDNFVDFKSLIYESEMVYPETLRTGIADYFDIVSESDSVCFVLFSDDVYVGNVMGCSPSEETMLDIGEVLPSGRTIYIYNILISPSFQGKGFGLKLMKKFIDTSIDEGFEFVNGNFRVNGSYKIAKKFNVIFEKKILNWENSGEEFVYCVISLK
jgi:GNAT superfamily N-acetyltransferase